MLFEWLVIFFMCCMDWVVLGRSCVRFCVLYWIIGRFFLVSVVNISLFILLLGRILLVFGLMIFGQKWFFQMCRLFLVFMYLLVMFGLSIFDRLQILMVCMLKVVLIFWCMVLVQGFVLNMLVVRDVLCGLRFWWWNLFRIDNRQDGVIMMMCGLKFWIKVIWCFVMFLEIGMIVQFNFFVL